VFVARRLAFVAVLLLALSMGLFYLLHVLPGSPEEALLSSNPALTPEDVARLRALRGLDRPIAERYGCWLFGRSATTCPYWPSERGILGGELGFSHVHKLPVAELLATRLPRTLGLMIPAFLLALIFSIALGTWSALRRGTFVDRAISALCFTGMALPVHWISLMLILVFAVALRVLPAGGIRDPLDPGFSSALSHAILPVFVLALGFVSRWTRFVRSSMLDVLHLDFVRTARANGLGEREVMLRHVLPNALLPLVTVVAQSAPALFSGALIVETVFTYPGIGVLFWESVVKNDHLTAIVVCLIYSALALLFALAADLAYAAIDPRIRVGKERFV
jgi:peptide/nickel transport system permease protein